MNVVMENILVVLNEYSRIRSTYLSFADGMYTDNLKAIVMTVIRIITLAGSVLSTHFNL